MGLGDYEYKGTPGTASMHHKEAGTFTCKVCKTEKPSVDFSPAGLARSFYWCRSCANRKSTERRRSDPAARLASRIRARERRLGMPVLLTVGDIRQLLNGEDPVYVREDLVTLARLREEEPLEMGRDRPIRQAAGPL